MLLEGLIIPTKHEYKASLPQRRVNLINLRSALKFVRQRMIQMRSWLHKKACCYWSKSQTNLAWPVSSIRAHSIFMGEISLPFDKQPPRLTALSLTSSPIILAFPLWEHFPLRRDLGCVFRFLLSLTLNYQCSVAYDKMQRYLLIFQTKIHPLKLKNINIFSTKTKDKYLF